MSLSQRIPVTGTAFLLYPAAKGPVNMTNPERMTGDGSNPKSKTDAWLPVVNLTYFRGLCGCRFDWGTLIPRPDSDRRLGRGDGAVKLKLASALFRSVRCLLVVVTKPKIHVDIYW